MEEDKKISPHAFNVKTEVIHNLIGGFAGGLFGYWSGAFGGSWLAYILFFVFGYLGYNFKQTLKTGFKVFTFAFSPFWKMLTLFNPHPILTFPVFTYLSIVFFAACCDGISISDMFLSLDKIWLALQANMTWKNTGVNIFIENYPMTRSLFERTCTFYAVGIGCVLIGALSAAALGWGMRLSTWCVTHPKEVISKIIALFALVKKHNSYPITTILVLTLCCSQLTALFVKAFPDQEKLLAGILLSIILFAISTIFWVVVGEAISGIVNLTNKFIAFSKTLNFKQAMLFLLKMIFMIGFYSTFGLAIVMLKSVVLTIIGIHSARRLACGLATFSSGALYMIFVPFTIETVPVAMLAIGCGLVSAATCGLIALALDGENAYHRLDTFIKKPIKSFAPNFSS